MVDSPLSPTVPDYPVGQIGSICLPLNTKARDHHIMVCASVPVPTWTRVVLVVQNVGSVRRAVLIEERLVIVEIAVVAARSRIWAHKLAHDRASGNDLGCHAQDDVVDDLLLRDVPLRNNAAVLGNRVQGKLLPRSAARPEWTPFPRAILADGGGVAGQILGFIVVARLAGDSVLMYPLESLDWVATICAAALVRRAARDQNLRRNLGSWE